MNKTSVYSHICLYFLIDLIIKHFRNTLCKLHIELYTLCLLLRHNGMFALKLEQNTLVWGNTLREVVQQSP